MEDSMMSQKTFFEGIEVKQREGKPREKGLTWMIDWGLGLLSQEDTLRIASPYIDLAKVAVGISRMVSEDFLIEKNALYRRFDVEPFPGGMLLELAMHQYKKRGKDALDAARIYYQESRRVGYTTMEVSDNVIHITPQEKRRLISLAAEEFHFKVLGEVGTKTEMTEADKMIADIDNCLEAGSWKAVLEAAEFVDREQGGLRLDLVDTVLEKFPSEKLIFEMPGPWNSGTTLSGAHDMKMYLIENLGPEVNLGNILPQDVVELETLRLNLGVGMKLK